MRHGGKRANSVTQMERGQGRKMAASRRKEQSNCVEEPPEFTPDRESCLQSENRLSHLPVQCVYTFPDFIQLSWGGFFGFAQNFLGIFPCRISNQIIGRKTYIAVIQHDKNFLGVVIHFLYHFQPMSDTTGNHNDFIICQCPMQELFIVIGVRKMLRSFIGRGGITMYLQQKES